MAETGRIRIRVPSTVRPGDVVRVRSLIIHPMERVERDRHGKPVERTYNYINRVAVAYLGKPVSTFETTQSVSENPVFSFAFKATEPGRLTMTFTDTTGGKYEGAADIKFS